MSKVFTKTTPTTLKLLPLDEEEINTHEKADVKLNQLSLIAKSWRCIEQVLGINHRSPSARRAIITVGCMNGTLQQI
ncbi:MAG: hypothetical protein ACLR13_00525 [Acutalibacteraceae bacterium]